MPRRARFCGPGENTVLRELVDLQGVPTFGKLWQVSGPAPDPKDATLQAATAIGHADRVAPIIKAVVEDNWLETAEDALCGWIPTWRESRAQS